MTTPRQTLSADDWLLEGFRALAQAGPSELRAEILARRLRTTKGSFYWHFKDVADYRDRLLAHWVACAFDGVIAGLDPHLPAGERLKALCLMAAEFDDATFGGAALEPALRAWGLSDPVVSEAVKQMDVRRIATLAGLCQDSGLTQTDLPRLLYATITGLETLGPTSANRSAMALLLSLLPAHPR